jgi:hypothetical protein
MATPASAPLLPDPCHPTEDADNHEDDSDFKIPAWFINALPMNVNEKIFSFVAPRRSEILHQKYEAECRKFEDQWHWDPDYHISRDQGHILENSYAEMEWYQDIADLFEEYESAIEKEEAADLAWEQRMLHR